jgi:hypothetical protein
MKTIRALANVARCFIAFMGASYDGSVPPVESQFGVWI